MFAFLKEIKSAIPNVYYYERENNKIKDIIEWAKKREFTDVMVLYEKHGKPRKLSDGMLILCRYFDTESLARGTDSDIQGVRGETKT